MFVLDEADKMLDMGFLDDVKRVVKHLDESNATRTSLKHLFMLHARPSYLIVSVLARLGGASPNNVLLVCAVGPASRKKRVTSLFTATIGKVNNT
jgi:superfamily II DNA/RNA helicase